MAEAKLGFPIQGFMFLQVAVLRAIVSLVLSQLKGVALGKWRVLVGGFSTHGNVNQGSEHFIHQ
jgi:hypothetical protein